MSGQRLPQLTPMDIQAADSLVGDMNPDLGVGWDVKLGRPPSHTQSGHHVFKKSNETSAKKSEL